MKFNPATPLFKQNRLTRKWLYFPAVLLLVTACATQPYQHESALSSSVRQRAVIQSEGDLTVSASVPSEQEATAIFGVPMYKRGIQPVWLEVKNNTDGFLRLTLSSVDAEYFSPLEVAYMHKSGFSKEARTEMERYFYESAIQRHVPAGESSSGFVFTHASPGTKSFNVDLYGANTDYSFAFFVTVPGFEPDHQAVKFRDLYPADELQNYDLDGFRSALAERQWMTSSESGEPGLPVSIVIVANGLDALKALLRAGWYEQPANRDITETRTAHYMFGRLPDATFRTKRNDQSDRNQLYVWQTRMRVNGEIVWMGRIVNFIGQRNQIRQALFGARVDPDIDQGRDYFVQNMWYSGSLEQLGWLRWGDPIAVDAPARDFSDAEYFSDGYVAIAWLFGDPVSLVETTNTNWDQPPHRQ